MKKRLLAISDIHGCYEEFKGLLSKANYDPLVDQLVLLGDYLDRGPDSFKVVELVKELVAKGAVALLGNHDQMYIYYMEGGLDDFSYFINGGKETLASYSNATEEQIYDHLVFLKGLPLFWETEEYFFVHAGLNPNRDIENQSNEELLWIREEWLYSESSPTEKTVVFGHSIVSHWFNCEDIYVGNNRIGINTGAGCGGYLSLYDLTGQKVYLPDGIKSKRVCSA